MSITSEQIIQLTKNEIDIAMQEFTNKKIEDLDTSDLFYLTRSQIFNDVNTSVATVKQDPKNPDIYLDEFGMVFTDTTQTYRFTYTNHVIVWRNKYKDPTTGEIKSNLCNRFITWDTNIHRGLILYCQATNDRIATKYNEDVYCDFCNYIIDYYTDTYIGNAPIKLSTLNNKDVNGNAWNIHVKKGNLYMCANKWYQSSNSGSVPAMFGVDYSLTTENIIYSNPEHTETMEYHVWLYCELLNVGARKAIYLQLNGQGQMFTKFYLHNKLLNRTYNHYLFPKASLSGCDPNKYHVKEIYIDDTSKREEGWLSGDGNFSFSSLYYFDYFAPIKLYDGWLAGSWNSCVKNTNIIRFLDLSEQTNIYSKQAFQGCDGQDQIIELTNCVKICPSTSGLNIETFKESKNYTLNLPVCNYFAQRGCFYGANNIKFKFYKHADHSENSNSAYYHGMFENAYNIEFICNNPEPYWSWSIGVLIFKHAYNIKFNKPLYINKREGNNDNNFLQGYGMGKLDNPKITIWGALNENTQTNEASKGINSPSTKHLCSDCDGANFEFLGNLNLGDYAFSNCSVKTKISYEGTLTLNGADCLYNCKCFKYLPKLLSFNNARTFTNSTVECIDMSKCNLDFVFPDGWDKANIKLIILPKNYTGQTIQTTTVVKRDNVYYGNVENLTLSEDQEAGVFPYCQVNITIGKPATTLHKYSFIGSTGVIKCNSPITLEEGWNYGGDIKIEGY